MSSAANASRRGVIGMPPGLLRDESSIAPLDLSSEPHAVIASMEEILPFLAAPDSGRCLELNSEKSCLTDGQHDYPVRQGLPVLMPERLQPYFVERLSVPYSLDHDAFLQYFLLASIKQSGQINAPSGDVHYQRHLFRMRHLLKSCRGLTLDVGCDDPEIGAGLLPAGCLYVGLDPFSAQKAGFRIVGTGEYLPFADQSVSNVIFNTSLDHILDWKRAVNEAHRVLGAGGSLFICTLAWVEKADLMGDSVHFHHFSEPEILAALDGFNISSSYRYAYKEDGHRYGLYLSAQKSNKAKALV